MPIFALVYWGRNVSFVFWENWKANKPFRNWLTFKKELPYFLCQNWKRWELGLFVVFQLDCNILLSEHPSCQIGGLGWKEILSISLGSQKKDNLEVYKCPFFQPVVLYHSFFERIWCQKAKEDSIPAHCSDSLRRGIKHLLANLNWI